jgi:hypothetical protein
MGAAARRRYEQLFTARAMGSAYAELYRQLAAERPPVTGRRPRRFASSPLPQPGTVTTRRTGT